MQGWQVACSLNNCLKRFIPEATSLKELWQVMW